MPAHLGSEDALERAVIDLFQSLNYETVYAYDESFGVDGLLGRETMDQVVLVSRLYTSLQSLNPDLPDSAIQAVVEILTADYSLMSVAAANQQITKFLRDGVPCKSSKGFGLKRNIRNRDFINFSLMMIKLV